LVSHLFSPKSTYLFTLFNHLDHAVTRFTFHHLLHPKNALEEMIRVTKPNGKIIVADATPTKLNQNKYNEYEKLRDPSHTIALTHDELISLGNNNSSIIRSQVIDFKLKYDAESLIDRAFPETVTHKELLELLTNDIGKNVIGFSPILEGKKLKIFFPITAVCWQKV
jgi:SAM-dependent methyltransferase